MQSLRHSSDTHHGDIWTIIFGFAGCGSAGLPSCGWPDNSGLQSYQDKGTQILFYSIQLYSYRYCEVCNVGPSSYHYHYIRCTSRITGYTDAIAVLHHLG